MRKSLNNFFIVSRITRFENTRYKTCWRVKKLHVCFGIWLFSQSITCLTSINERRQTQLNQYRSILVCTELSSCFPICLGEWYHWCHAAIPIWKYVQQIYVELYIDNCILLHFCLLKLYTLKQSGMQYPWYSSYMVFLAMYFKIIYLNLGPKKSSLPVVEETNSFL